MEVELAGLTVLLIEMPIASRKGTSGATDIRSISVEEARSVHSFRDVVTEELPGGFALHDISYASIPVETMISTFRKDSVAPITFVATPKTQPGSGIASGRYLVVGETLERSSVDGNPVAVARRQSKGISSSAVVWEGEKLIGQVITQNLDPAAIADIVRSLNV